MSGTTPSASHQMNISLFADALPPSVLASQWLRCCKLNPYFLAWQQEERDVGKSVFTCAGVLVPAHFQSGL